jgi:hypothetical protein
MATESSRLMLAMTPEAVAGNSEPIDIGIADQSADTADCRTIREENHLIKRNQSD